MEDKFSFAVENIKDSPMLSAEQIVDDIMKHLSDANKYSSISRKSLRPLLERYFHFWINKAFDEGQKKLIKDFRLDEIAELTGSEKKEEKQK